MQFNMSQQAGKMGPVPKLTDAPIPPGLERLLSLGLNRAKVAILVALSDAGGAAPTRTVVDATGIIRPTVLTALRDLEEHGYVLGDVPFEERRQGVPLTWSIQSDALAVDLRALAQAWTPRGSTT